MRLSDYILRDMEHILTEWEAFAATLLPAAAGMTGLALRDHAQQILETVAKDLNTSQTRAEQVAKAKGLAPEVDGAPDTAAHTHAVLRARSGFDINQLIAEYRALRASVLHLWADANPAHEPDVKDVIRFNEAIDQAIAESVSHFNIQQEQTRNLMLGMLGHDMRTPLNSIVLTASYLAALHAGEEVSTAAERLIRGGKSIQALLDDLVDFNRSKLGLGIKVVRADIDLAAEVSDEVEQLRGAYPDRQIELSITGSLHGRWDGGRLKQVVRNLVSNAIRHGGATTPIRAGLHGAETEVRLEVTNNGSSIDASTIDQIFDPLKRGSAKGNAPGAWDGLGLGLFIVREIVAAHGGGVEVCIDDDEATFTVRLPRNAPQASD